MNNHEEARTGRSDALGDPTPARTPAPVPKSRERADAADPAPDSPPPAAPAPEARATWLLIALAAATFVAHLLVAGNWGYFRDELYYLADGHHLQAGYVDQPALLGWLAALLRVTLGNGIVVIHIVPALACALLVVVTGLIAWELGGGASAQLVAAVAAMFMVDFMAAGSLFSMDVLDQLWWALGSLALARIARRGTSGPWLLFGAAAALGFLTKLTILFFGFAVAIALLATPERRWLRTRWPWIALGMALVGLAPYLAWNAANHWLTLDFYRHYRYLKAGPLEFFTGQIALMNPVALPLVVCGLVFYFSRAGRRYRMLGWIFVILYLVFTAVRGKPYFLGPAYPIVFAAGAVLLERVTRRAGLAWIRPVYVTLLALVGLLLAPFAMPILSPEEFAHIYGPHAAPTAAAQPETAAPAVAPSGADVLPQNLSDRLGWVELARTVERVAAALPPEERAQACVLASNYGEASALALLSARGRMPPVVSGHNNYFVWGPGSCSGSVIITVGYSEREIQAASASFKHAVRAATATCPYCVAYERSVPIYVLSNPKSPDFSLAKEWPALKHFD